MSVGARARARARLAKARSRRPSEARVVASVRQLVGLLGEQRRQVLDLPRGLQRRAQAQLEDLLVGPFAADGLAERARGLLVLARLLQRVGEIRQPWNTLRPLRRRVHQPA